jgi:Lipase (class 3)
MPKSYDSATVELAMTLSTLAYVDENRTATQQQMIREINAGLEEAGYKAWQVVWGPSLNVDRSNLAYVARNSVTGQLAVSIRGSDFSFWLNWIEDLAAIRVVSYDQFVPSASKSAQIAFGTAIGLRQVLGMRDGTTSLESFLTAAPEGTPILITGHSLGGCIASALAPCVADWRDSAFCISVYTIAAPSPGNADFATYYNALFTDQSGHSTAFRFQQPGCSTQCLGKPCRGRDILPTFGCLPPRHHQNHSPRRNSREWEVLPAWRACRG